MKILDAVESLLRSCIDGRAGILLVSNSLEPLIREEFKELMIDRPTYEDHPDKYAYRYAGLKVIFVRHLSHGFSIEPDSKENRKKIARAEVDYFFMQHLEKKISAVQFSDIKKNVEEYIMH